MRVPLVGVTGRRLPAAKLYGSPDLVADTFIDVHFVEYVQAIARVGGIPVQLCREADPTALVERLDGIVLAGGSDIDPRLYGAKPGPDATPYDPERDAFEIALVRTAVEADKPLLAVCRRELLG